MHKHDQGFLPGCRWCELDDLLGELAAEHGASNLDSYLRTQMHSVWNAQERRAGRTERAIQHLVDAGIPREDAQRLIRE